MLPIAVRTRRAVFLGLFVLVAVESPILAQRAAGALGCVLSGAGPSILVFFERGCEQVCDLIRQVFALHGQTSEVLYAHVAECGFELREEVEA